MFDLLLHGFEAYSEFLLIVMNSDGPTDLLKTNGPNALMFSATSVTYLN